MNIAYFINQYPKVSHSFIRREITALERQGFVISRLALRGWDATLVDKADISEQQQTRYILANGFLRLIFHGLKRLVISPSAFIRTLSLAVRLGYCANRPLAYHLIYLLEACVILDWMKGAGCDHVHAHFGTNSAQVAMFAHLLGGIPYSFTVHGPEEFDMPGLLHIREKTRYAKFVVAISSYGRSQLFRHIDIKDWPKVQVVHCGVDAPFFDKAHEPVPDTNKVVCVGRLCEQKGQLLLIHALRQLKEGGVSVELVLAGDGEMRGDIESLVSEYDLSDCVKITGWVDAARVRAEILGSRAMVLPSFAEGLPVVIMEAFALRRPVVSTYVAGIPELVINGENGWLVPAGSVDCLAEALKACLSTPAEKLNAMGEAAYQRVLARHSIGTEAAKIARLIRGPG